MQIVVRANAPITYYCDLISMQFTSACPLHAAVFGNQIEIVRLLLAHGADPNFAAASMVVIYTEEEVGIARASHS